MKSTVAMAALLGAAIGIAGVSAPAAAAAPVGCQVYEKVNFKGTSYTARRNQSVPASKSSNRISSIKVWPGCYMVVYPDNNYRGPPGYVRQNLPVLKAHWDNLISSYKCLCQ